MKFGTKDLILIFIVIIASWIAMFVFGFQLANRISSSKLNNKELAQCLDELSSCQKDYTLCSKQDENKTETKKESSEDNTNVAEATTEQEAQIKEQEETKQKDTLANLNLKTLSPQMKGKYTVQVGAFKSEYDAQQLTFSLYNSGFKDSYYREVKIPGKGLWYRVGIGFFSKRDSAEVFANMLLQQNKIKSYIIRKL